MSEPDASMTQQVLGTITDPRQPGSDGAKTLYDSTQKWFWDVGNVMIRGLAFYLALMAAVVGYVLTGNLKPPLLQLVLSLALITSVLFLAGWAACVSVMFRCIEVLDKLKEHFTAHPSLSSLQLKDVLPASRRAVRTITAAICIVVLAFICAIGIIWKNPPSADAKATSTTPGR